jgi:hypothetical protein
LTGHEIHRCDKILGVWFSLIASKLTLHGCFQLQDLMSHQRLLPTI